MTRSAIPAAASGRPASFPVAFEEGDRGAESHAGAVATHRDIVPFLLHHALLEPADIVCGQLDIVDVSRRNRNFSVATERGAGYLIKQGVGAEKSRLIRHEAEIYRFFASRPELAPLQEYLPRFYLYDAEHCILVVERVGNARSLFEHHTRVGRLSRRLARTLGEILGRFHGKLRAPLTAATGFFLDRPPFGLSLHRPDLKILDHSSQAGIELVRIVQGDETACARLDELHAGWRPETLIHGDLRWENCIVAPPPAGRPPRIAMVDWELARFGDPAWDVGTVFGEYLAFWLLSAPIGRDLPPEEFLPYARYPLAVIQPAVQAFWEGYRTRLGAGPEAADASLTRAIGYAAVRLLQTAYERLQPANEVTAEAVLLLQLGVNVLQRPLEAGVRLFGMPLTQGEAE
jgi:hypothetical protein